MFSINTKEIKRMEADLKTFARRAYPFATRNTINKAAFTTQSTWRGIVSTKMVERNKFTRQSIRVAPEKRELNVNRQQAIVGSTADYMEDQEFGGIRFKRGRHGVPIATGYSAGQEGARPRTRLPRRPNKLQNIRLSKRKTRNTRSKAQENLVRVKTAAQSGQKYVLLDLNRGPAIFRVLGGKRNLRVKMVHDLSRQSVVTPKNPTLLPAVDIVEPKMPGFYRDSLVFQLKRNNLFRGS